MARAVDVFAGEARPYPRLRALAGIRFVDVAVTVVVAGAVELFVAAGSGPGQQPLNAEAYLLGAVMALPVLFRRRWPLRVLIACSLLLVICYSVDRRNIPPAPLLSLPVYDAAAAGYLLWAVGVPAAFVAAGLVFVEASSRHGLDAVVTELLPRIGGVPVVLWLLPVMIFSLAVVLGELVRGRRALAAETARRLRIADDERQAEAAMRVAEERLRIARELHDTVAHSMATVAVQAGSALQLLGGTADSVGGAVGSADGSAARDEKVRDALAAIRATSKNALSETRATLGQLRQPSPDGGNPGPAVAGTGGPTGCEADGTGEAGEDRTGGTGGADGQGRASAVAGLDRLPALRDAVAAAGVPVTVIVEGTQRPLPGHVDHAAYRILQESLTNVLRHAGPDASAAVRICYEATALSLEVTDDGAGGTPAPEPAASRPPRSRGHGLTGMTERATAIGGELAAGPRPGGGFAVTASLPLAERPVAGR